MVWRKRVVSAFVLILAIVMTGCSDAPPPNKTGGKGGGGKAAGKRFILLTNGNSPFWDAARVGLEEGAKDLKLTDSGITAVMEVNDGTPGGQISKLRQFATQPDIIGVAVSALDADNAQVVAEMKNLRKKGVHVITVDADVNRDKFRDAREFYIGTDNFKGGQALGICGKGLLESRGKKAGSYVQFVGRTGSDNAIKRMNGFKSKVGDNFKEADRMGDDLDKTKARDNVRNALTNHKDIVALVGIWSYNAPAIVDVVEENKVRDQVTIVTFDAEPVAIKQMAEGKIDAMVVQNPYDMGYQSMKLLKAMVEKDKSTISKMFPNQGKKDGDIFNTGLKVVVASDKSPLKADMFAEGTEFMLLSKFQEWLKKYSLEGS